MPDPKHKRHREHHSGLRALKLSTIPLEGQISLVAVTTYYSRLSSRLALASKSLHLHVCSTTDCTARFRHTCDNEGLLRVLFLR